MSRQEGTVGCNVYSWMIPGWISTRECSRFVQELSHSKAKLATEPGYGDGIAFLRHASGKEARRRQSSLARCFEIERRQHIILLLHDVFRIGVSIGSRRDKQAAAAYSVPGGLIVRVAGFICPVNPCLLQ